LHRAPKALGADLEDGKVTIAALQHDDLSLTSQDDEGPSARGVWPAARYVKLETGKDSLKCHV